MSDITLQPEAKMWEPRTNREHPPTMHLLAAIKHWHAKRMRGKAATYPTIEFGRDVATQRTGFFVSWLEADLPRGLERQRIIVPEDGSELAWELRTP